jgi:alkaline phosphatase
MTQMSMENAEGLPSLGFTDAAHSIAEIPEAETLQADRQPFILKGLSTLPSWPDCDLVRSELKMTHLHLRRICLLLLLVAWGSFQAGCQTDAPTPRPELDTATADTPAANPAADQETPVTVSMPVVAPAEPPVGKVRNVILFIGDGMGPQQMELLFAYAHLAPGSTVADRTSAMELMMRQGNLAMVRTEPHGAIVTDSAAAATQMATGQMAGAEMIGVNYRGESVPTVLEIARDLGKSTGLVSDTRVTHATPAGFAAHQRHRSMENEIAGDMLGNRVDVMLSGGLRHWVPQSVNDKTSAAHLAVVQMVGGVFEPTSEREDNRNLLVEARPDYHLVFDRTALADVEEGHLLGLFANSEMCDAIAEKHSIASDDRTEPTLVEMTQKALEILSQNPQGFFLMVEGGQIDWSGHNNDTGCMLQEMLQLDDAVRYVLEWVKDRDDTVVLLTADHETGSFGFSYSGANVPEPRTLGGDVFQGAPFAPSFNFGSPEVLDQLDAQGKSFWHVFLEYDMLPEREKTPEKLMELVNDAVKPFAITLQDATDILARAPNRYYVPDHAYLGTQTVPAMPDQEAFYVYGENLRMNHLGHILGVQQNVVWGSGTHTATPVALVSIGPPAAIARFTGLIHSTDIGKGMIALVRGE